MDSVSNFFKKIIMKKKSYKMEVVKIQRKMRDFQWNKVYNSIFYNIFYDMVRWFFFICEYRYDWLKYIKILYALM